MLDIGWSEFFVIGVIALVVIGPRELPTALRSLGRIISRARSMAQDFKDGLDDIARETEVKSIADNMIGDFDDDDEEWMDAVNAKKLEKKQTPIDGEEAKQADAEASVESTEESAVSDADEAAMDAADADATASAEAPKPKDAQS